MNPPAMSRWDRAVHYRYQCEGECGADTAWVAVIRRKGQPDIRLCRTCYADGFWRTRDRGTQNKR